MQISLKTTDKVTNQKTQCLVLPLAAGSLASVGKQLGEDLARLLARLEAGKDFTGAAGQTLLIPYCEGIKSERLLLVGLGKGEKSSERHFDKGVQALFQTLKKHKLRDAFIALDGIDVENRDLAWQLATLARNAETSQYHYDTTLSRKREGGLKKLWLQAPGNAKNRRAVEEGQATGAGINVARQLGNLPGNYCTPTFLASEARALGRKHPKLKVSVLEEKKMAELGMGALLSVTAGTRQPAKLIVMEYKGGPKTAKPHAIVGKGITFDSGGISIKPGAKMDEMKFDMCGAASVMGTMHTICALEPAVNVVAIIAAAENLPGGAATKPGDVVTSMSGQTIEILNTDAEGRLVLCDALTYCERFKPASTIDIATLTGACVVALGKHASALYSNDDDFARTLLEAGTAAGDRAWHMPLWDDYQKQLDSPFADMANVGGPEAGSVTAACFLARYTENMTWAHLDIAGTAWLSNGPKGATGRPVGLLTRYLLDCAKRK